MLNVLFVVLFVHPTVGMVYTVHDKEYLSDTVGPTTIWNMKTTFKHLLVYLTLFY